MSRGDRIRALISEGSEITEAGRTRSGSHSTLVVEWKMKLGFSLLLIQCSFHRTPLHSCALHGWDNRGSAIMSHCRDVRYQQGRVLTVAHQRVLSMVILGCMCVENVWKANIWGLTHQVPCSQLCTHYLNPCGSVRYFSCLTERDIKPWEVEWFAQGNVTNNFETHVCLTLKPVIF